MNTALNRSDLNSADRSNWEPQRFTFDAESNQEVQIFATWEKAHRHIRDHLLSVHESHAWQLVSSKLKDLLDEYDGRVIQRDSPDETSMDPWWQQLYLEYAKQIRLAFRQSISLGWVVRTNRTTLMGLGITGALYVLHTTPSFQVGSAFFPGVTTATQKAEGKLIDSARVDPPAPYPPAPYPPAPYRHRGRGAKKYQPSITERLEKAARFNWNDEEKLFYVVFKPALQFLRKHQVCRIPGNEGHGGEYGKLKYKLGSISRMTFERWQELLQKTREQEVYHES